MSRDEGPASSARLTKRSRISMTTALALSCPPRSRACLMRPAATSSGVPRVQKRLSDASISIAPWTPSVQSKMRSPRARSTKSVSTETVALRPIALTRGLRGGLLGGVGLPAARSVS
jgi:hypothetical protein